MTADILRKPRIGMPFGEAKEARERRKQEYYLEAVRAVGGEPVIVSTAESRGRVLQLAATLDGILLPGSAADVDPERYHAQRHPRCAEADPAREETDLTLLDVAFVEQKPIFTICYGTQFLNVFRGGSLVQHIDGHEKGVTHTICCQADSIIRELAGAEVATVNSYHHQAIVRAGRELRVVAHATDGTIEAVEGRDSRHFVVGVQWHPERDFEKNPLSRKLFEKFVQVATK